MRSSIASGAAVALAALWLPATFGITAAHAAEKTTSWPSLRTAGPFLLDEMRFKADGKWGLVWRSLYPAHRLVAPRATYVRCEQATPFVTPRGWSPCGAPSCTFPAQPPASPASR